MIWLVLLGLEDSQQSKISISNKLLRRRHRRAVAQEKAAQNVQAQLNKPDFDSRLKSFVQAEKTEEMPEKFVSQMKSWQRSESYQRSPTRPIELLRQLLQRIAKLVGRS